MQGDTVLKRETKKNVVTRDEEEKQTEDRAIIHEYIISSIFFNNSFVYSIDCSA
jgi:hypothetical protein